MDDRRERSSRRNAAFGPPVLRVRLWLESDGERFLELSRVRLLEEVRRLGSLNQAARSLGMSYRGAWGRIVEAERILGEPLLIRGGGRAGSRLTPLAGELVHSFCAWRREVEEFALRRGGEMLPWGLRRDEEEPPA